MPRGLGTTTLQILSSIRSGRCYGLDIVANTGLPSGTVYPTLGRLKKRGLVTATWEPQRVAERESRPRRRYYKLSPEGERALSEGTARIIRIAADLGEATGSAG